MTARRVMIYVQHLLGIGHFKRAALLAGGLARGGYDVDLVSGGMAVEGGAPDRFRIHQLPPLRATDLSFDALVDDSGRAADDRYKEGRRRALIDLFESARPDVLIVETYPFGRRMMRFELGPLLARADSPKRPLILSSIRDVLQQRRPERIEETVCIVSAAFDAVLVHGDPSLIPLDASFPAIDRIRDKVHYTGYIADPDSPSIRDGSTGEVVVSAGGGAVGKRLLETALAARPLSSLHAAPWRLLAGDNLSAEAYHGLRSAAEDGVIVERARPDFRNLLAGATLSISQAGYNTILDLLQAGAPAIVVPFGSMGETEQPTRARHLAARGWVDVVPEDELTPRRLAAAVDARTGRKPPDATAVDLSGVRTSTRLVDRLLERSR